MTIQDQEQLRAEIDLEGETVKIIACIDRHGFKIGQEVIIKSVGKQLRDGSQSFYAVPNVWDDYGYWLNRDEFQLID